MGDVRVKVHKSVFSMIIWSDFVTVKIFGVMSRVLNAASITQRNIAVCTDVNLAVLKVHPVEHLGAVRGGPFALVAAGHGLVFTVVRGDTAPFVPSFVLVYQISSGVFRKSIEMDSNVLALAATETHLFVSIMGSIHVFDNETLTCVGTIERRSARGIFAVSDGVLAYPYDDKPGSVTIVSIPGFSVRHQLNCHKDAIRALAISPDGKTLATASDKGTLVRTFDIESGQQIGEFRRGFRGANVIAVDTNRGVTCACTETSLHVFPSSLSHIVVSLTHPPLDVTVNDGEVDVVTVDGILSLYRVDGLAAKATLLTQHKLVEMSMIDQTKRGKRRITF